MAKNCPYIAAYAIKTTVLALSSSPMVANTVRVGECREHESCMRYPMAKTEQPGQACMIPRGNRHDCAPYRPCRAASCRRRQLGSSDWLSRPFYKLSRPGSSCSLVFCSGHHLLPVGDFWLPFAKPLATRTSLIPFSPKADHFRLLGVRELQYMLGRDGFSVVASRWLMQG